MHIWTVPCQRSAASPWNITVETTPYELQARENLCELVTIVVQAKIPTISADNLGGGGFYAVR